jgi:CBS domain-containing protein
MPIKEVLDQEDRKALKIESDLSVEDAINLMTKNDAMALIVVEGDRPVGIFTEKDVLLSYVKFDRNPYSEIKLKNAMTNKLIVAKPEDEIDGSISLMIQTGIRHLPVVEGGEIIALLYLCDLVQHQVGTLSTELHYLEEYLNDLNDAGRD